MVVTSGGRGMCGEIAIHKMEVAGDMGVTGDVVVSGYDDKNK